MAVFSKLDCNSGFFQITLTYNCTHLTTLITPFGRFCFKRLPFEVTSASEVYQKRMSAILEWLEGVVYLINDVLVFRKNQQQHDIHQHAVQKRMLDTKIMLNGKCLFLQLAIKFQGPVTNVSGIKPDSNKVAAIVNMRVPQNVTELRNLLGLINQLSKFSDWLADISKPLGDLLQRDRQWVWDINHEDALTVLKKLEAQRQHWHCMTPKSLYSYQPTAHHTDSAQRLNIYRTITRADQYVMCLVHC